MVAIHLIHFDWLHYRRMERKQKHLGWQLRHTALPIILVGLVLNSFNDSYKVSQQWQICQLHCTSTASGQHTSMGSLTFCRLRNFSMFGRSVFLKVTVSSHSNMKEIKYKIKYKYIRGPHFDCQESLLFQEHFRELQGGGLCLYNQADFIVFKNKWENHILKLFI